MKISEDKTHNFYDWFTVYEKNDGVSLICCVIGDFMEQFEHNFQALTKSNEIRH